MLDGFNTHFDVWYSERTLHSSGAVERGFEKLREQGHMFEADGAVWLRTSDFDDDKDRVLVKADGELTYFASDTAYYVDKRNRGFDVCIYLLGADHHGYVPRLKGVIHAIGDMRRSEGDPNAAQWAGDRLEVPLVQLVALLRDGDDGLEVLMVKRASTLEFHGGAWVFPGGRIDDADWAADAAEIEAARRAAAREHHDPAAGADAAQPPLHLRDGGRAGRAGRRRRPRRCDLLRRLPAVPDGRGTGGGGGPRRAPRRRRLLPVGAQRQRTHPPRLAEVVRAFVVRGSAPFGGL